MRKTNRRSLPLAALVSAVLLLAGCSSSADTTSASGEKSGGLFAGLMSSSKPVNIPEGTALRVTLEQALSSDSNKSGDEFEATVADPVMLNGKIVIPKGATVQGKVIEAQESGRLKGVAVLRLALSEMEVEGKSYEVSTSIVSFRGTSHTKRNTAMIGGGAGAGALIGGLAGGGKGTAIGAAVGAGAGTAGAAATGKKDIKLAPETRLEFKLTQPVTVHVKG
jgi:hypothetical protein